VTTLSGASVDTDESGSVVALNDYYPFGDTRIESGEYENDYTYTGKERDEDTELLYYEARGTMTQTSEGSFPSTLGVEISPIPRV
jgi:hypothetical protein